MPGRVAQGVDGAESLLGAVHSTHMTRPWAASRHVRLPPHTLR